MRWQAVTTRVALRLNLQRDHCGTLLAEFVGSAASPLNADKATTEQ
jgi:hypothetical protein